MKDDGQYLLAAVVFFFSIVFPITKLATLGFLWMMPLREEQRATVLNWLKV